MLADATAEAATVLEDALSTALKTGELFMLAELYRLRGRLGVRLSRFVEAEADFLRAGEAARRQGATLFDLRAASDLAQLWADQGLTEKAANHLAPVLKCFPQTHDMPDLVHAQKLLKELSRC
jgi:predicted ATPase